MGSLGVIPETKPAPANTGQNERRTADLPTLCRHENKGMPQYDRASRYKKMTKGEKCLWWAHKD